MTTYSIDAYIETNVQNYNSIVSDKLSFTTICDSNSFTNSTCKSSYGPVLSGNDYLSVYVEPNKKDPSVPKWPNHKISSDNCSCKEYNDDERVDLCKKNLSNGYLIDEDLVKSDGGLCQNKIIKVGPVLNLVVTSLFTNQDVEINLMDHLKDY